MSPEVQARVLDRLIATGTSDEPWALIVLAAMDSAEQLDGFLDKKASVAPPQRPDMAAVVVTEPPGAEAPLQAVPWTPQWTALFKDQGGICKTAFPPWQA